MATKPDPVNDLPPAWGGAGNYSAGVYSPLLPWGDANPLAGQPLPWGAQPRLNSTNLTSFANAGHTPQVPDNPSQYNEWLRRLQVWVPWIISGSPVDGADAHIVETDAGGIINVQAVRSTTGYVGLGNIPARFPVGATVASGEAITLEGTASLDGTTTSTVTAGTIDTIDANGDVLAGGVIWYPGTPGFTLGVMKWDGRALTMGNGLGAAPPFAQPLISYIPGPIAAAAFTTDTGASVILNMLVGSKAKVVATASVKSDTLSETIRFTIEANGVVIGNADPYEVTSTVSSQPAVRVIVFTSGIAGLVTFKARYGAGGGGTTTATDISIEASLV